jgi:hypothetical protein
VRLATPTLLELRAEGDHDQHGQPCHSIERKVEQFARVRINPMRILEDHQNRSALRQGFELIQQRFEHHLSLSLRAETEFRDSVRQ